MNQNAFTKFLKSTPMLKILVPMALGILMYDQFLRNKVDWSIIWIAFGLGICGLILGTVMASRFYFSKTIASIASIVMITLVGIGLAASKDIGLGQNQHWSASQYSLAVIDDHPIEKEKTTRYTVRLISLSSNTKTRPIRGKGLLYVSKEANNKVLQKGDTIMVAAAWKPIKNQGNPFERDYKKYCARKQIFHQQFVGQNQVLLIGKHHQTVLEKIHNYGMSAMDRTIEEPKTRALLKAMILGNEKEIDPIIRQAYSDTGVIHIVSISGAHVALLFVVVNTLLGIGRLRKYPMARVSVGLFCIWFYVLLAGASTPALRAAIMFSIVALGQLSEQRNNQLNYLFSAAFILLLIQPMWLFDIGFQLSFVAVLSLLFFYEPILLLMPSKYLALRWLASAIAASVAAEILVAPLVVYYFNSFPIMFVLANLLASLVMTILLVGGLLLLLLSPISLAAKFISWLMVGLSQIFHSGIQLLQSFGGNTFRTIYLTPLGLLLLYLSIIFFAYFWVSQTKKGLWLGLCSLLFFSIAQLHRSISIAKQEKFVVYAHSRYTQCELISGQKFFSINGNTSQDYSHRKAHIGWGCNWPGTAKNQSVFLVANKKILVWDSTASVHASFPIDILVMTGIRKVKNIAAIIEQFKPQTIVITQPSESKEQQICQKICAAQNIRLHNCTSQGAFIFPQ